MTGIHLHHTTPILACADIETALAFCVERLGFRREWTWGDPPNDGGAVRDGVRINFMRNADLAARARDTEVMVFVQNIDALYAEHQARGAPITSSIEDKEWGLREYTVTVPPGYRLRFAEGLEYIRKREAVDAASS